MRESSDMEWTGRTRVMLGDVAVERLAESRVAVIGVGAVGGYVVESLARSGVGAFFLADFDVVKESNLNRQLFALRSTVGRPKAEVARVRVGDINPDAEVYDFQRLVNAENMAEVFGFAPDLVIDAVDSLTPKVDIIEAGARAGVPVFSSLGAATRVDAGAVTFGPLFKSKGCPLGRLVRKRLRRRGVDGGDLWCVYSSEDRNPGAVCPPEGEDEREYRRGRRRNVLGSLASMTGLFGLRLAHEVVLRLAGTCM